MLGGWGGERIPAAFAALFAQFPVTVVSSGLIESAQKFWGAV